MASSRRHCTPAEENGKAGGKGGDASIHVQQRQGGGTARLPRPGTPWQAEERAVAVPPIGANGLCGGMNVKSVCAIGPEMEALPDRLGQQSHTQALIEQEWPRTRYRRHQGCP